MYRFAIRHTIFSNITILYPVYKTQNSIPLASEKQCIPTCPHKEPFQSRRVIMRWLPVSSVDIPPWLVVPEGIRADSKFAPSQWETPILCNGVSHWPGANLESALGMSNDHSASDTTVWTDPGIVWLPYVTAECQTVTLRRPISLKIVHTLFKFQINFVLV